MELPRYPIKSDESFMIFEFTSYGPNGPIKKIVKFSETNLKSIYNIAFGDCNSSTGEINDTSVSNNGDSQLVLATVVSTVYAFTEIYPGSWIFATGSTKSRTRLYRMGINKYISEIKSDFHLFGLKGEGWEPFINGVSYEAFLAKRK